MTTNDATAAAAADTAEAPVEKRAKMSHEHTHPNVKDGWFKETCAMWPGQAMTLQVKKILHTERSKYQDVLVFESESYGNVLVLDGVIQATERDEFAYQEMIAHVPLNAHPNPRHVLIVGGGDGGVLREVVKHECVEEVTLCEIDEAVPRVSKLYLKDMASGFDHSKVKVHIGDGFEFLKDKQGCYDVIITDSSDPVGPAESLFQDSFFSLLHAALKPEGIICSQGECIWLHLDLIARVLTTTSQIFSSVDYAYISIPTYPCGTIGLVLSSKEADKQFRKPVRSVSHEEEDKRYRYYNAETHEAAFKVPTFVRKAIARKADGSA
ncbi:putrescine aminopropyltransferase [Sorochytrium milnesiophthora]